MWQSHNKRSLQFVKQWQESFVFYWYILLGIRISDFYHISHFFWMHILHDNNSISVFLTLSPLRNHQQLLRLLYLLFTIFRLDFRCECAISFAYRCLQHNVFRHIHSVVSFHSDSSLMHSHTIRSNAKVESVVLLVDSAHWNEWECVCNRCHQL